MLFGVCTFFCAYHSFFSLLSYYYDRRSIDLRLKKIVHSHVTAHSWHNDRAVRHKSYLGVIAFSLAARTSHYSVERRRNARCVLAGAGTSRAPRGHTGRWRLASFPLLPVPRWILRSNYVSVPVTYACVHMRAWSAQKWVYPGLVDSCFSRPPFLSVNSAFPYQSRK